MNLSYAYYVHSHRPSLGHPENLLTLTDLAIGLFTRLAGCSCTRYSTTAGLELAGSPESWVYAYDDSCRGCLGLLQEGLGQSAYELAQSGLNGRGCRSGYQEQGAGLARGQP